MKIPIMSYAINLTFRLLVWLVPGEKFYGLGTGFQFQTIPVPLYVLNPMGLLCIPRLICSVRMVRKVKREIRKGLRWKDLATVWGQ